MSGAQAGFGVSGYATFRDFRASSLESHSSSTSDIRKRVINGVTHNFARLVRFVGFFPPETQAVVSKGMGDLFENSDEIVMER